MLRLFPFFGPKKCWPKKKKKTGWMKKALDDKQTLDKKMSNKDTTPVGRQVWLIK